MKPWIRSSQWLGLLIASLGMIACSTPDNGIGQALPALNNSSDRQSLTNEYAEKERSERIGHSGSNSQTGGLSGSSSTDRIEYGQNRGSSSSSSFRSEPSWMDQVTQTVTTAGLGLLMGVPQFLGSAAEKIGDQVFSWLGDDEEESNEEESNEEEAPEAASASSQEVGSASQVDVQDENLEEDSVESANVLDQISRLFRRKPAERDVSPEAQVPEQDEDISSISLTDDSSVQAEATLELHSETCEEKSPVDQLIDLAANQLPAESSQGGDK